jgi:hypothetical protein
VLLSFLKFSFRNTCFIDAPYKACNAMEMRNVLRTQEASRRKARPALPAAEAWRVTALRFEYSGSSPKNSILAKIGGEYHELQAEPGRSWREHHSSFCNGMLYFRDCFPDSHVHNDATTTISEILHN